MTDRYGKGIQLSGQTFSLVVYQLSPNSIQCLVFLSFMMLLSKMRLCNCFEAAWLLTVHMDADN